MTTNGVIIDSLITFKLTWESLGKGQHPKWDQTKQYVEIHESDVYPDLKYISAYGAAQYYKYNSGALLNSLIMAINAVIDAKIAGGKKQNEELALPGGQAKRKELLPGGEVASQLLLAPVREPSKQDTLPPGPEAPKQLGPGGEPARIEAPKNVDTNQPEPGDQNVTQGDQGNPDDYVYTVTVYGNKLRFIDGQQERGAYAAGIRVVYKVSNNLLKTVGGEQINNTDRIWLEVKFRSGAVMKMSFDEFTKEDFDLRFGSNLLVEVLPSVEVVLTPDPNSVYAKERIEGSLEDVIAATKLTLHGKSYSDLLGLEKELHKAMAAHEPAKQGQPSAHTEKTDANK